ncbi:unnamed protein product [Arabis nemorensis]|uniref:Uncharacterized protein n=1 Tax=Arabis nemorensis TaxID=586526 RepID=A0A565AU24_9BRAS|nr:unnamed protein product [Arabis nemorensis]
MGFNAPQHLVRKLHVVLLPKLSPIYGSQDEEKAVIETPPFHSIAPKSFCFRCSWDCRMSAPRYRLLPLETDLNQPPLLTDFRWSDKMPFSKSRVSIAVQRVGQTLVLSPGPDEEGEKLIRREHQDESLFLNFAMHSVRMEACDCPPVHHPHTEGQSSSSALPARRRELPWASTEW